MGGQASSTNSPGTAAWSCNPNQVVEEYSKSINTITAAAWAAGGNMNTARQKAGGTLSSVQLKVQVWLLVDK